VETRLITISTLAEGHESKYAILASTNLIEWVSIWPMDAPSHLPTRTRLDVLNGSIGQNLFRIE
jgi:hypothetical protein